jgi:glucokinase
MEKVILAGDLGGSKTDLALFSSKGDFTLPIAEATFASSEYDNLESMVSEFLAGLTAKVSTAVLGVAGPVFAGQAKVTNLHWLLEERQIAEKCGLHRVTLINDLVAIAYALPHLPAEDFREIISGKPAAGGSLAVIAPGTGLGEAFLVSNGGRYLAYPSEGGHADFAPANECEIDLLRFLKSRYNHVSYEHICSGQGLPNIYDFFRQRNPELVNAVLDAALNAAKDRAPIIFSGALDREMPCEICRRALRTFISILGAEAGNLTLKVLATGGVFLAGGIPPRLVTALAGNEFLSAFRDKGRMRELLEAVPVKVVMNSKAALFGAVAYGLDILKNE